MEVPQIDLTIDQRIIALQQLEKIIEKHGFDLTTLDGTHKAAIALANNLLSRETEGFATWRMLPDTNSMWDYIDKNMTHEELLDTVIEACNERLEGLWD